MTTDNPSNEDPTPSYFTTDWCGFSWTKWVSLENKHKDLSRIPTQPGLYRVRPTGGRILVYIGQTGRSLRGRMRSLRGCYKSPEVMPWSDPHVAAGSLWALRDAEGCDFEVSVALLPYHGGEDGRRHRMGQESYLLWKYRCEHGSSTLCNYGRIHPQYFRSTNRSRGIRGGRLPDGMTNPSAGPSTPPLENGGSPQNGTWMGLAWELPMSLEKASIEGLPKAPALYMMLNPEGEVIYIGETHQLRSRLTSHVRKKFRDEEITVSYVLCPEMRKKYQRLEWENDCIGAWVEMKGEPPERQF